MNAYVLYIYYRENDVCRDRLNLFYPREYLFLFIPSWLLWVLCNFFLSADELCVAAVLQVRLHDINSEWSES